MTQLPIPILHRWKRLLCRILGHHWYEGVLWVAGQRCSSGVYCDRCFELPRSVTNQ